MKIYAKVGLGLLVFLLFAVSVYGIYHHGLTVANAQWQAKWDKRDPTTQPPEPCRTAAGKPNRPTRPPSNRYKPMPRKNLKKPALTLLLPLLLLTGCASESSSYSPPVAPAQIPPLPAEARQEPTPAICLPTCSTNLSNAIETWQKSLILP